MTGFRAGVLPEWARAGSTLMPTGVTSLSCRCADGSSVTLFDDGVVAGAMAGMMIAPPADPRCRGVPAGVWPIPTGAAEPSRPDRHLPCCRNAISTSIGSWLTVIITSASPRQSGPAWMVQRCTPGRLLRCSSAA